MNHFNSESAYPVTVINDDDLTMAEIATSIIPPLIGMAVVGLLVVLMLL